MTGLHQQNCSGDRSVAEPVEPPRRRLLRRGHMYWFTTVAPAQGSGISRLRDPNGGRTRKCNLGGSRSSERRCATSPTGALHRR